MKSAIILARSGSYRPPPDHRPANDNDPPEPPPTMRLRLPARPVFSEIIARSHRRHMRAMAVAG